MGEKSCGGDGGGRTHRESSISASCSVGGDTHARLATVVATDLTEEIPDLLVGDTTGSDAGQGADFAVTDGLIGSRRKSAW